jgi:hypothetical protein
MQPHSYALLDDSERVLNQHARDEAAEQIRSWAAVRSREASLSATVLRRLPSPNAAEPWDVIADIRMHLQPSLRRFRAAMSEISTAAEAHPLEEDFDAYAEHVWRSRIAPALNELDELVREASIRSVFFGDVLGDLSSYAGPVIGIGAALSQALPALASAAIAAASPCGCRLFGHITRPAHTHGSAHRVDPAAQLSQPTRRQLIRQARVAVPVPKRGAGGARCNGRQTLSTATAAAGLRR